MIVFHSFGNRGIGLLSSPKKFYIVSPGIQTAPILFWTEMHLWPIFLLCYSCRKPLELKDDFRRILIDCEMSIMRNFIFKRVKRGFFSWDIFFFSEANSFSKIENFKNQNCFSNFFHSTLFFYYERKKNKFFQLLHFCHENGDMHCKPFFYAVVFFFFIWPSIHLSLG